MNLIIDTFFPYFSKNKKIRKAAIATQIIALVITVNPPAPKRPVIIFMCKVDSAGQVTCERPPSVCEAVEDDLSIEICDK